MIGVQAQNPGDDMTSYITNPNFTGNADGWTITGDARYYTKEGATGFDGTARFIELTNWGSSWDATISQTVTVPNGYYKVKAAGQMSGTADCWMKLVANDAESRFSRNGDTNGNILANGTETTIGSGVAGWRYTSVIAHVTNGSLEISCVGHSNVKERWANFDAVTLTYLGTEIAPNTDVTEYISNWDFWGCFNDEFNGWTIEKTGGNSWVHGNTAVEHWSDDFSRTFDFYQSINNLPEGRYQISASMWNTQGTPNGNSGVYGTSSNGTVFAGVTVDCDDSHLQTYTTDGIFVSDGTLRLGVKNNGARSTNWFGVDWIKLQYVGKVVQDYAVALPNGGAMVADTWYYFDIAVAGDEYNATATTLGDIICTDDGNTLTSAATGNVTLTATDNNFAAKRYYVKSSSANNLEIGVASYTYTVSEASVDKTYIQPSQTVTVSFTASTNDPGATLAQDYSGVTFDGAEINVVPGASGFTFTVPANLTANTEYTLAIPAEAIGYAAGSTYNEAQNITLKTPAIFDGIYYFYNTYTENYLSRGGNYGTQAIMDNYGVPAYLAFDGEGKTRVKFFDNYKFLSDGGWLYADNATGGQFFVDAVVGGYKFKDATNTSHYVAVYDNQVVGDAQEGDNLVGTSNVWSLETPAQYDAKDNATTLANAQASAAATAAGIAGITTLAGLETELASHYGETSITITGAKAEKYNVNGGSSPAKYVEETVNDLKPGIYRLTVDAFQRASSNDRVAAAGGASSLVYAYAGTAKTRIKSVMAYGADEAYDNDYEYNEKHYPNNEASAYVALGTGNYDNTVYVYVADAGEGTGSLTFGINNPQNTNAGGYPNALWAVYDNFTLTYFEAKATPAEKEALTFAIADAEAKTLGFEDGEYAPYNNVDALTKLAAAKSINPETASGEAVVNATTALNNATWTANVGNVECVYNGNFAEGQGSPAANIQQYGWTRTNGWGQFKNDVYGSTTGYYNQPGSLQYGNAGVYLMPLKANTIYRLQFQYNAWDGETQPTASVLNAEEGMAAQTFASTTQSYKDGLVAVDMLFATGSAGNYILSLTGSNNIVFTGVSITKAASQTLTFADDAAMPKYAPGTYPSVKITRTLTAGKWATAVYPFAVSGVDDIAVLDSYNSETGEISFATAAASTANEPFLMRSTEGTAEISLSNVAVAATVAEPEVTKSVASLKGVYASGNVPESDEDNVRYVVSSNQLYKVDGEVSIKPFRAYFELTGANPGARPTLRFDDVTGINTIEAAEAEDGALKDGKYIIDNKVVIVKNGMKYSANGQKLN